MAEPRVIADYLTALSAQLPGPVVDELADGLDQTRQRYLGRGLQPEVAAEAAVAEFGEPQVIVAAFTRLSPARRAARMLLLTGPLVGGSWGMALITSRAWSWPVPIAGRILLGLVLVSTIGLLISAAFGTKYRSVCNAGTAGCLSMTALDTTMLLLVALACPAIIWPVMLAAGASTARLAFTARHLRPVLSG